MADLLDIAPSTAVNAVKIADGRWLTVRGLRIDDIAAIAARFPSLVTLLAGGDDVGPRLIAQLGPAAAPIIAAGGNHPGDEKAERNAAALPLEDQIKLIAAIWKLTFPNGFAPLMEAMVGLMTGAAEEEQKTVKIRLKKSPSASPPSSGADSRPIMQ